jgi:hypothetical protein
MSLVTLWVTKDMDPLTDTAETSRKSDFAPSLCRLSHEPLTSWASHGDHSQPGPR